MNNIVFLFGKNCVLDFRVVELKKSLHDKSKMNCLSPTLFFLPSVRNVLSFHCFVLSICSGLSVFRVG